MSTDLKPHRPPISKTALVCVLLACWALLLACLAAPAPTPPPADPRTEVARSVALTSSAEKTAAALESAKTSLEQTAQALKITQAALANPPTPPTQQPTYTPLPTYTSQPTLTQPAPTAPQTTTPPKPPAAQPSATPSQVPYQVSVSTKLFYCFQEPSTLKVSVEMPDINKGAAVYFRLRDKVDGRLTDWVNKDLRRETGNIRSVTLNGSGFTATKDILHPPLMHESIFEMQIITDDGTYRSKVYTDVTYVPCAQ